MSNFPTEIDNFPKPWPNTQQDVINHDELHNTISVAVEQLELKLWIEWSSDNKSVDYKLSSVPDWFKAESQSNRWAIGWYAPLDSTGKVPIDNLPTLLASPTPSGNPNLIGDTILNPNANTRVFDWTWIVITEANRKTSYYPDWIRIYSPDWSGWWILDSYTNLVWTYDSINWVMNYTNWTSVELATWNISQANWVIAYANKHNVFTDVNEFLWQVIFKSKVTVPFFHNWVVNGWTFTFDWLSWINQTVNFNWTTSFTFNTKNTTQWVFTLAIVKAGWTANINFPSYWSKSTWWTSMTWILPDTWSNNTLLWFHLIGTVPTELDNWVHIFTFAVFETAVHVWYCWKSVPA